VKSLVLLLLLVPALAQAAQTRAFVATTDFSAGAISTIELGPPRTAVIDRAVICSDAVLRYSFGTLYAIERFGCDNIRAFNPANLALLHQYSVGNGANPNDLCEFQPGKAYIARYDTPAAWVVAPASGFYFGDVDLSAFADEDGLPEMNRMVEHAGRVFVSCQRLDRDNFFSPTDSSLVIVIDTATNQPIDADPVAPGVQGILLPRTNPTTEFSTTPEGDFLIGCTGAYGVLDGAVVRLDPRTLQATVEVTEADLGGDINDVAVGTGPSGATRAFCVISDASFNTVLVSYERNGAPQVTTVHQGTGFVLADAEVDDRDEVWLCDRTASAPGVRIFDALTRAQLTASPINTGLPPNDICFDSTEPVGVPPSGSRTAFAIGRVLPNPGTGAQTIRFANVGAGTIEVLVADAAGRVVRSWSGRAEAWTWDGRDAAGRLAPAGVYLVRARQSGSPEIATARLVRVRL